MPSTFSKLGMLTGLARAQWEEQGTTTLGTIAKGVLKLEGASELPYLGCYATSLIKDMVYSKVEHFWVQSHKGTKTAI